MHNSDNVYFITGHHGVGKTYLSNKLSKEFQLLCIDTGSLIRKIYMEETKGNITINEWVKSGEAQYGRNFSNNILCHAMELDINNANNIPIFIIGNRSIKGINYILDYFGFNKRAKLIYLDAPFSLLKKNYILRENNLVSNNKFKAILKDEITSGLKGIKDYVLQNSAECLYCFKENNDDKAYKLLKLELLKKSKLFKKNI